MIWLRSILKKKRSPSRGWAEYTRQIISPCPLTLSYQARLDLSHTNWSVKLVLVYSALALGNLRLATKHPVIVAFFCSLRTSSRSALAEKNTHWWFSRWIANHCMRHISMEFKSKYDSMTQWQIYIGLPGSCNFVLSLGSGNICIINRSEFSIALSWPLYTCYGRCWRLEDGGHLPRKMLAITYKWLLSVK